MSEQQLPTWAEKHALQWLIGQGRLATIIPSDLVPLYVRRGYAADVAKRVARNALGRLTRKGFMHRSGEGDRALWAITRSGKRAAQ